MNGLVIGLVMLVVPGCSGCVALDKTGTSGFKSVGVASQTLKKQEPAGAGSFGAEREGFEPSMPLRAYRFSRPTHSTTLPPLQNCNF